VIVDDLCPIEDGGRLLTVVGAGNPSSPARAGNQQFFYMDSLTDDRHQWGEVIDPRPITLARWTTKLPSVDVQRLFQLPLYIGLFGPKNTKRNSPPCERS
jgi:hypothetical protein